MDYDTGVRKDKLLYICDRLNLTNIMLSERSKAKITVGSHLYKCQEQGKLIQGNTYTESGYFCSVGASD